MKLWTVQPVEWYLKLQEQQIISGEKQYVDECFLAAYDWLIPEMENRIGNKPYPDCYPIWAWYQYENEKKPKPDLRNSALLNKGKAGVCIEIEKDVKDVLLSDFTMWHFPIAGHYISDSEEDDNTFDLLLKQNGFVYSDPDFDAIPVELKHRIIKSWDKIFDLNYECNFQSYKKSEKQIQATFWSLCLNEIVKVTEFIAR
jgi:hypothetical protein